MNDRRTTLAILLSIIVVIFYTEVVLRPQMPPPAAPPGGTAPAGPQTGPAQQTLRGPAGRAAAPAASASQAAPSLETVLQGGKTVVSTDLVRAEIAHLGGRLVSYELLQYPRELGGEEPVDLVDPQLDAPLPLGVHAGGESDASVRYEVVESSDGAGEQLRAAPGERAVVRLQGVLPGGTPIEKRFTFIGGTYFVEAEAILAPGAAAADPAFEWTRVLSPEVLAERWNIGTVKVLTAANKLESSFAAEMISDQPSAPPALAVDQAQWISYGDTYFLSALIPSDAPAGAVAALRPLSAGSHLLAMRADPAAAGTSVLVYAGPKDSRVLEAAGHQLERTIDFGVFSFISFPLLWMLRAFEAVVANWGLAVILLTLVIKTVFLPLNVTSFRSMRAMQDLQPEMKALRERIKDPAQLNQELLQLYKRRGVNPMGGCLPILIQIPVFFGLFSLLPAAIELRHAPFALWVTDLSSPERLVIGGIPVPLMTLFFVGSMFVQQWMMPAVGDPLQRKIMLIVPVVIGISFIVYPFPAGLVLYWLVNNVVSIIQQAYIRSDKSGSPLKATLIGGAVIFAIGYVLTLI